MPSCNKRRALQVKSILMSKISSVEESVCAVYREEPYRIRVIYWIYGTRSTRLYRTRVLDWIYGIRSPRLYRTRVLDWTYGIRSA